MNKVITINLNGRAYQLDEDGFDALRAYLDDAQTRLESDPGKSEIITDLEQAIAEKCDKLLGPTKSVVTTAEVRKIIDEMGPVEGDGDATDTKSGTETNSSAQDASAPKRLYRIEEGAMIWGVANGLAVYFGIDVIVMRVIFVLLTLITGGGFCLAYFAMMVLIPEADTMQEKAAAHGEPFNAQELVNRAKAEYMRIATQFSGSHDRHLQWRAWKHEMKMARKQRKHARRSTYEFHSNPLLGMFRGVLAALWILALISIISTGAIFGWAIPAAIPIWVAVVLLFILYHAVTGPMKAAGNPYGYTNGWDGQHYNYNYAYSQWDGIGDGLTVLFLAIAFGWAYLHVPQVYTFVHHPIMGIKDMIAMIKMWFHH